MAIDLATKFLPYVDEKFTTESKKSLLTNQDFKWEGAKTVKVYKVGTSSMNDYDRTGSGSTWSRYGEIKDLDAITEEMTLKNDRSFTFTIDKLDKDETVQTLEAASALERQVREVVIPEVDTYVYSVMCANAGNKPEAKELTSENIFTEILTASNTLDNAEVPETSRYLIVTPNIYLLMKQCKDIIMETDISAEMRVKGVIATIDGVSVIKVPAVRLPEKFGFLMCHPTATVAPVKLQDFKIHNCPVGFSGDVIEGRVNYDAFVLDNKVNALYYQELV